MLKQLFTITITIDENFNFLMHCLIDYLTIIASVIKIIITTFIIAFIVAEFIVIIFTIATFVDEFIINVTVIMDLINLTIAN